MPTGNHEHKKFIYLKILAASLIHAMLASTMEPGMVAMVTLSRPKVPLQLPTVYGTFTAVPTSTYVDDLKECHELDPVDEEQTYDEVRGSYVQPRSEPLDGKQMSHSCDSIKGTIVGKADYDNDINPIRFHINQRDNLNTDLYSYSRIGNEHGSDGYDICSSASRFRKTGRDVEHL
ncbi:hypothetical protein MAR_020714 [Mya arenaria]|uniref:Uncharacterized protein n=1 Tax=Mya arenaria TaxID=6604 RepID=A0ABY7E5N3_MYAAR|nr:hypothetical protein MAR_020714 [Mya arenaria]